MAALAEGSTKGAVQIARDHSNEGGPFPFMNGDTVLRDTDDPTAGAVERALSKLVVLRDAVLVPRRAHIFDNFEAKNSSRSGRWDAWHTLPPWTVCSQSQNGCKDVRLRLDISLTTRCLWKGSCLSRRMIWATRMTDLQYVSLLESVAFLFGVGNFQGPGKLHTARRKDTACGCPLVGMYLGEPRSFCSHDIHGSRARHAEKCKMIVTHRRSMVEWTPTRI